MTATPRRGNSFGWSWLWWTAGFLAFPIAGVAGRLVAGRVDDPVAALLAGLVTGAVVGAGQWLASRGRLRPVPWIVATTVGMGVGLLLGATVVGFQTSLGRRRRDGCAHRCGARGRPDGGATGPHPATLVVGRGDAAAVGARLDVTTLAGIPMAEQFTIFGASGAVTFSALSGLLLYRLLPPVRTAATDTAGVEAPVVGSA